MFKKPIAAVLLAVSALAGCINDGTVADKHPITFEKPNPGGGPSKAQSEAALRSWLVANVPEGDTAKNISVGPVRYAAILWPFPEKDFFVCARYTAKNQYGTFEPPRNVLMTMRVYDASKGWQTALVKDETFDGYRQYCIGQPHA